MKTKEKKHLVLKRPEMPHSVMNYSVSIFYAGVQTKVWKVLKNISVAYINKILNSILQRKMLVSLQNLWKYLH